MTRPLQVLLSVFAHGEALVLQFRLYCLLFHQILSHFQGLNAAIPRRPIDWPASKKIEKLIGNKAQAGLGNLLFYVSQGMAC